VNLGLGTNVSEFSNISLVADFNQTGNGTFCLKETGRARLEAAIKKAGLDVGKFEGTQATLQVIQISHGGASLFNVSALPLMFCVGSWEYRLTFTSFFLRQCADITFNSSAPLLEDNECTNTTGVGGVEVVNADDHDHHGNGTATQSGGPKPTGAAALISPAVGVSLVAGLLGLMFAEF